MNSSDGSWPLGPSASRLAMYPWKDGWRDWGTTYLASVSTERTLKWAKCTRSAMTERKKEDEKKPAKLAPFVEPQLFVAVEEANRRLKEIMKVTDPTTGLYRSIQRITEVSEMMLRRQDQLRKLYEPSESVRKYLERIKQMVEQITRTKMDELPTLSRTIIPQLEGEVSGYVETFERALAEKEKEIEALKAELEALKSKTKNQHPV
jgi:SMC interacting uncharacterized protein involved in chromosome segregation